MGFFNTLKITGSALEAQRLRMDVIANNIANAETTRTVQGGPYRRQMPFFTAQGSSPSRIPMALAALSQAPLAPGGGVKVSQIIEDTRPGARVYAPDHPDADKEGYVTYPNVDIVNELIDLMSARRSYEASVTALNAAKNMALKALEIGR